MLDFKKEDNTQKGKVGDTHETSDIQRSSGKDFVQSCEESVKPSESLFKKQIDNEMKGCGKYLRDVTVSSINGGS